MKDLVLFEGASDFGTYRIVETIYEGRPARVLFSDDNAPQSGVALDDEPDLLFDYNQRLLEIALSIRPKTVLVIGGGMLTLPLALSQHFSDITIDVVEIDELLPQLARRYFGVDDPRIRVTVQDGRQYMQQCASQYDLIIIDAFSGLNVAQPLLQEDIVQHYARSLRPAGVVAVNFISKYYTRRPSLAHELQATFLDQYKSVELYPADCDYSKHAEQNIVLCAAVDQLPAFDYLQSNEVTLPALRPR